MDAPKCRLCGLRHWGACAGSPSVRAIAGVRGTQPARPLVTDLGDTARVKKSPRSKKAKPKRKAVYAGAEPAKKRVNRGRPLASEAHLSAEHKKPWDAEGMSRRTWYRRKLAKKKRARPEARAEP
jgi:hypothetical protein